MAINAAGEVEIPRLRNIEKGVAIIHVQDRIFEVAAVVGFLRHLDHGILAWRVQENCSKKEIRSVCVFVSVCFVQDLQRESPILRSWYLAQ